MTSSPLTAGDVRHEVELASARIAGHVRETPCEPSPALDPGDGGGVLLKMENLQVTCSFKARGAVNKILSLPAEASASRLVTASVGNHAMAMLYAVDLVGGRVEIWVSDQISRAKLDALRGRGADLHVVEGGDPGGIEVEARLAAESSGRVFVSPYNDLQVIGGQGTVAMELLRQVGEVDAIYVPVGGGGLAAGVASYLKETDPAIRIIGCQPANSPIIAASILAGGGLLDLPWQPSLSDGTVGLVEPGSITYPLCRDCIDDWVLVDEAEIEAAMRLVMREHCVMIEGAAAVPVAAYLQTRERWSGRTVACILTGARISLEQLGRVLREG